MATERTTLVGCGVRDVTPPAGTWLSGFAARRSPAVGTHDPLCARAVAFGDGRSTLLAVVLDVIGVDEHLARTVREGLRARSAVRLDDIVVVATHTHGGPAVLRDAFLGPVDEAVVAAIAEGAVMAGLDAVADMSPATLEHAVGHQPDVAHNRRVPGGPIDPRVQVVRARREPGHDVVLVSYACHPVVLGPDNLLFTRDYPGFLVDGIERRLPGATAVFLGGCCGQVNSGHPAHASVEARSVPQRTYAQAERIGETLAEAAVGALASARQVESAPVRAARSLVDLPMSPPPTEPSADKARWLAELEADPPPGDGRRGWLEGYVAWAERYPEPRGGAIEVPVACWSVGDLRLAWFPGEVFVEQALELAGAIPGPLVCVANAEAAPGYVPHPSAYAVGGYEVEEAYRFYGTPGPLAPEASTRLDAAMRALLDELSGR